MPNILCSFCPNYNASLIILIALMNSFMCKAVDKPFEHRLFVLRLMCTAMRCEVKMPIPFQCFLFNVFYPVLLIDCKI